MPPVSPQEIANIIKSKYPQAQVEIIEKGTAPGSSDLKRYTIKTHLFGSLVELNYGENLLILLDGHVVDALKYPSLLGTADIKKAVEFWFNDIQKYLSHHDLPLVKHLAEKYLGKEDSIKREKRALYVFYDAFFYCCNSICGFSFFEQYKKIGLFYSL